MAIVFVNGAVDLSIDVFSRLPASYDSLDSSGQAEVDDIMSGLIVDLREYIIDNWPVDTRRSQQSWELQWVPPWWIVRNPVEYAEYVHPAGQGANVIESWTGVEEESEALLDGAMGALGGVISRSAATGLQAVIRQQAGIAARLREQAARVLRTSLFAATVEAYRTTPSRARELQSRERLRSRLRER